MRHGCSRSIGPGVSIGFLLLFGGLVAVACDGGGGDARDGAADIRPAFDGSGGEPADAAGATDAAAGATDTEAPADEREETDTLRPDDVRAVADAAPADGRAPDAVRDDVGSPADSAGACSDDPFEPNETQQTAFELLVGTYDLVLCNEERGAYDWFRVHLDAGDYLRVSATFEHAALDIQLALRDSDRFLLATSETETDQEAIEYRVPSAMTLFLIVYTPTTGAAPYRLEVTTVSRCDLGGAQGYLCGDDAECVDVETDVRHCGGCDQPCSTGLECVRGGCTVSCAAQEIRCGLSCVDPRTDLDHCGECDRQCAAGEGCVDGECGPDCAPVHVRCDGECTDLTSDRRNCGRCGHTCLGSAGCENGECVL